MDLKPESQQQQKQQLQQRSSEIEQFLYDVRAHFRASLATSEYENTSNLFHVTAADETEQLLERCELLLQQYAAVTAAAPAAPPIKMNGFVDCNVSSATRRAARVTATATTTAMVNGLQQQQQCTPAGSCRDEVSYTEMTSSVSTKHKQAHTIIGKSREYIDTRCSMASDKTFRSSGRNIAKPDVHEAVAQQTGQSLDTLSSAADAATAAPPSSSNNNNNLDVDNVAANAAATAAAVAAAKDNDDYNGNDDDNENDDDERQIYDICQVSSTLTQCDGDADADSDETQKAITPDLELAHAIDCPYMDLPAGHLAIQHSTKYGQLQRIEKRLFFDQSKKCYCGVLKDWLLCYADGPTSSRPSTTLHLKSPGIEIEHSGEGKRREICFQITTATDANKKYVFYANNEVDAKEWIHAIEAAIRGDGPPTTAMKLTRKLPTPPVVKKVTFLGGGQRADAALIEQHEHMQHDCIYEEPSPIYNCGNGESTEPPLLPLKNTSPSLLAKRFEYDVPKCPALPLELTGSNQIGTLELLNSKIQQQQQQQQQIMPTTAASSATVTTAIAAASSAAAVGCDDDALKLDFQTKVKDLHSKLSSQLSAGPNPERLKKALKKTYSNSSNEVEAVSLTSSPASASKDQKKQKKSNTPNSSPQKAATCTAAKDSDKSAKNWFLNRLNKTSNSSTTRASNSANSGTTSNTKCKQSEKENLLNSLDACDDGNGELSPFNSTQSSNPTSPCLKSESKASKVNMIINQFETSGHLATMFSVEALAANALASLTSLCDNNDCNNYEPIMTVSTPPSSYMKKV